ncbi:MAG: hypothetical protein U5K69_04500 [Balneolaceae bacterium]|nr:hypothetical protein [Balneolaceae bacterium]
MGKHAKEKCNLQWIADFRDPWTAVYYNKLMPRTRVAAKIDERLERSVLKEADEVVVISETMAEIQQEIVDRSYNVIPNGFDPDDFEFNQQGEEPCDTDKLTIRFVGSVRDGAIPYGFLASPGRCGSSPKI